MKNLKIFDENSISVEISNFSLLSKSPIEKENLEFEESRKYGAAKFKVNGYKIIFRIAKTTPSRPSL